MTDSALPNPSDAPSSGEDTDSLFSQVRVGLADVQTAKATAIGLISSLQDELARQVQVGEQLKTLLSEMTSLRDTSTSLVQQTQSQQATAIEAVQNLQNTLTNATDRLSQIEKIRAEVEATQSLIAEKNAFIEDGRLHVERTKAQLEQLTTDSQRYAAGVESSQKAARERLDETNAALQATVVAKTSSELNAEGITKLLRICEEHNSTTKRLADIAEATESNVKKYEAQLHELIQQSTDARDRIEALLPGATGTSLASAFLLRRGKFWWPTLIWQLIFLISVASLAILALWDLGLFTEPKGAMTWEQFGLSLVRRLPYVLPLVWLAYHASNKAELAQRLEEDYAFKETVSRSFEGFRKEMSSIQSVTPPESPLATLCSGVLRIITEAPGRVFERPSKSKSPMNVFVDSAGKFAGEAVKAAKAATEK